jgi:riboflavin transporter FmnP
MNYSRLGLAALGGMVASFAFGFLVLWLVPALINEGHKYSAVFRPKEEMMTVMPIGIVATFIAILVVAIIFAMIHQGGSGTAEGARFGVLIGIFVVCAFVLHNYVNLNIGLKLALGQAVAYFVQWTIIGIVIGLIYKPSLHHNREYR